jgi:DNA mismatch repair ATPase MutS
VTRNTFEVVNGRHPTVELGLLTLGRVFTPNSVTLACSSRLHIITGPNMAGKSTFLRQIALIAILAQTGSFVPADHAVIGIVDKLFSRVGAKDDLFRDRSTFMVEMLETAEILRRATPNSLVSVLRLNTKIEPERLSKVIMDEVGRGTTVKDGLAIAFATVHYLVSVNRCRALFATHFHELSDLLGLSGNGKGQGVFEDVEFFCTDVDETDVSV